MEWVWKKAMKPGNKAMNAGNRRTEGALERREPWNGGSLGTEGAWEVGTEEVREQSEPVNRGNL